MGIPRYIEEVRKKYGITNDYILAKKIKGQPTRGQLVSSWQKGSKHRRMHSNCEPPREESC